MDEKDIYQDLTKSQVAKFKEESACNSHWDFLSFLKNYLKQALISGSKIYLEQFKKKIMELKCVNGFQNLY